MYVFLFTKTDKGQSIRLESEPDLQAEKLFLLFCGMFVRGGVSVGRFGGLDPILMGTLISSHCRSTGSVFALMDDVGVDVEIGEKYEHKDHVSGQEVLSPGREIAVEG